LIILCAGIKKRNEKIESIQTGVGNKPNSSKMIHPAAIAAAAVVGKFAALALWFILRNNG
jgi:hypothetical protein